MRRTNLLTMFALLLAVLVSNIHAQSADPSMTAADQAFAQAVAKSDRAALEKLLDPDFTWTDFNGQALTRTQFLEIKRSMPIDRPKDAEVKNFTYGALGDVQVNFGRRHLLRVWVRRAGAWKLIACQEVVSLESAPTFAPGAGKDCENPCKGIPFRPSNDTERAVAAAYSKLETAAMAKNSAAFSTMVGDEFVAASSNSNKLYDKRGRMDDFDHSKNAGVAPTPFGAGRMYTFGEAVLMISEHLPDRGRPLHVTRIWVKRDGNWMETLSYQTSVQAPAAKP